MRAVAVIAAATLVLAFASSANAQSCNKTCVSVETFETNTNPKLWEGPTSGSLEFCKDVITWAFCPQKVVYDNVTYETANLDNFAKAYFEEGMKNHNSQCNSGLAGNQCHTCEEHFKYYSCVLAFQPCTENTNNLTPACNTVCSAVVKACTIAVGQCTQETTPFYILAPGDSTQNCSDASSLAPVSALAFIGLAIHAILARMN